MTKLDRNPQPVLDAICKVWHKYPDMRVGQMLDTSIILADTKTDLFNVENEYLAAIIMAAFKIEDD